MPDKPPGPVSLIMQHRRESVKEADATGTPPQPAFTLAHRILKLEPTSLRQKPKQRLYMLRDANSGEGVFVQGKVGILAASGGTGKSWALAQLAIAIATGATWFGGGGWAPARSGRVLWLSAEEDEDEVRRQLHFAARQSGIVSEEDYRLVCSRVDALALAGYDVALSRADVTEGLPETRLAVAIRSHLKEAALQDDPYTLSLLDPLSRFAGFDVEKDNSAATRFVQVLETFTSKECGLPSALMAHHVKKVGKDDDRDSSDLIRGASALVAAVRWAAILEQNKREPGAADLLTLRVVKANGVPPREPLVLCRPGEGNEGALRVATRDEMQSHTQVGKQLETLEEKLEPYLVRVRSKVASDAPLSRKALVETCGNKQLVLAAVRHMLKAGELNDTAQGLVPAGSNSVLGTVNGSGSQGSPSPFRGREPGTGTCSPTAAGSVVPENLEPAGTKNHSDPPSAVPNRDPPDTLEST